MSCLLARACGDRSLPTFFVRSSVFRGRRDRLLRPVLPRCWGPTTWSFHRALDRGAGSGCCCRCPSPGPGFYAGLSLSTTSA